jgi:hypothetical protein
MSADAVDDYDYVPPGSKGKHLIASMPVSVLLVIDTAVVQRK